MMEKRRKKAADSSRKKARPQKQKTTIIFQGGGSRGAHQAGAMKYLDEIGVKPDIIIGSSIGVINACLYATGGVEGMIKFWTSFKANPISSGISLRENIFLGNSFLSMRRGFEYIEGFFDFEKIFRNQTEICFALTNLSEGTGEIRSNRTEKTWQDFRTITRIAYTIPGLYPPIQFEGDYWCDGGFVWNIPFEYALGKGATRIFMLLCIARSLPRQNKFSNIYQVLSRFYDVMWIHVGSGEAMHRDFTDSMYGGTEVHLVEPSNYLEGFGMMSLLTFHPSKAERYIEQGYQDARKQLVSLK